MNTEENYISFWKRNNLLQELIPSILLMVVLFAIFFGLPYLVIVTDNKAEEAKVRFHQQMNTLCAPDHFVSKDRAGDGLDRIICISDQGRVRDIYQVVK